MAPENRLTSRFEVGKTYVAHDPHNWEKALSFTVKRKNKKTLRILAPDGEKTIPFFENAFDPGGELCCLEGYRLVSSREEK